MTHHTPSAVGMAPSQLRKRGISEHTAEVIQACRQDFAAYMTVAHETDVAVAAKPARHHYQMMEALLGERDVLFLCPREAAKTTLIQYWLEWTLGRASLSGDPQWAEKLRIIYISATAQQAYRVANAIRDTIEYNQTFQACFPKVKPHRTKWSETEWKVQGNRSKDANFLAIGRQGPVLGARGEIIVLDDIVDVGVSRSPADQEAVREWIDTTVEKVLVPWGRFIMAATRWYEGDPSEWAEEKGFQKVHLKALYRCEELPAWLGGPCLGCESGEHSYWPERFTVEKFRDERERRPMAFSSQRQNELTPMSGLIFKRAWFQKRFQYVPGPEDVRWAFATWDTAATLTGRSYSVGIVFLIDKFWRYYLLDMYREQQEFHELADAVLSVGDYWGLRQGKRTGIIIENKSSGIQLVQEFNRRRKQGELPGLNVIPIQPPGERGRIGRHEWNALATKPCEEGRVLLPSAAFGRRYPGREDWTDDFITWMCRYNVDEQGRPIGNNDVASALCNGIAFCEFELRPAVELDELNKRVQPVRWGQSRERAVAV